MNSDAIVVFEDRPCWLPELQRRFDETDVVVRGCSSPQNVLRAEEEGTPVIVLVMDRREAACLEILGRLLDSPVRPRLVCVASETNADLQWPAHELGATAFLTGHVTSDDLARLCRRLLKS